MATFLPHFFISKENHIMGNEDYSEIFPYCKIFGRGVRLKDAPDSIDFSHGMICSLSIWAYVSRSHLILEFREIFVPKEFVFLFLTVSGRHVICCVLTTKKNHKNCVLQVGDQQAAFYM